MLSRLSCVLPILCARQANSVREKVSSSSPQYQYHISSHTTNNPPPLINDIGLNDNAQKCHESYGRYQSIDHTSETNLGAFFLRELVAPPLRPALVPP